MNQITKSELSVRAWLKSMRKRNGENHWLWELCLDSMQEFDSIARMEEDLARLFPISEDVQRA